MVGHPEVRRSQWRDRLQEEASETHLESGERLTDSKLVSEILSGLASMVRDQRDGVQILLPDYLFQAPCPAL
jgi:hypothetical protein